MYVWVPRYEYKISGEYGLGGLSTTTPGEIEVNFISRNQTSSSNGYKIHPAFNFGGIELSGIWVGKFELSHNTYTTKNFNCINESCSEANNLRILPNKESLRNNSISSFFYMSRSMSMESNAFRLDSTQTDSHMIKNNEWGAIAYLSQSKYGKYGNSAYTGVNKEIYQNKSSNYITGSSNGTPSTNTNNSQCTYDDTTNNCGIGASTTGNIYGIYDMSGGTWEYTMGVYANSNNELWTGKTTSSNSGFKGKTGTTGTYYSGMEWPDSKYYDVYVENTEDVTYGAALIETEAWYNDSTYYPKSSAPWSMRGGDKGNNKVAGIFNSSVYEGSANSIVSTRVVLTENK